jgi:hypothetical protein
MSLNKLLDGQQRLADVEVRGLVLVHAEWRHLGWRRSWALDRVEDLDATWVGNVPEMWQARHASGERGALRPRSDGQGSTRLSCP